jgi:hypothetical protein
MDLNGVIYKKLAKKIDDKHEHIFQQRCNKINTTITKQKQQNLRQHKCRQKPEVMVAGNNFKVKLHEHIHYKLLYSSIICLSFYYLC